MTNYTKNGLVLILIGMIIGVISNVLFFIFQYIMSNEDISSFFGLIGFGIIGGIGGIIVFIGAIVAGHCDLRIRQQSQHPCSF